MNGHDLRAFFQARYPEHTAYAWDHVGLQVGSLNAPITGIMIALDATKVTLKEAIDEGCNVLLTHHPLLFHPLKKLSLDTARGSLIQDLLSHSVTVYAAHTNYDVGEAGMNQALSEKLKLQDAKVLDVDENGVGIGRIGTIEPMSLEAFIDHVKSVFELEYALLISNKNGKTIKKVAISGGSGAHHAMAAKKKGADLYLTGDISYHDAQDILEMGLSALDIGHFSEHHFKTSLQKELLDYGINVPVKVSLQEKSPYQLK